MEAAIAGLVARAERAEAEADRHQQRADQAEARADQERHRADVAHDQADQERQRANYSATIAYAARAEVRGALQTIEQLQQAEAARKARGRLARLRAAWRGE